MNGKKKAERKKRVPLGAPRRKLAFTGRQGFKRRVINDVGTRLDDAIAGGYQFVLKDGAEFKDADVINRNEAVNNCVCRTIDKTEGTKGYLMEIPIAYYNEDQAAKQKVIDEQEDAILNGEDSHGKTGADGRYVPRGGNTIKR